MAEHRPKLLKTHRARIENMLYVLPKQVWPTALLYYHVMARTAEGIRENVLLCKAWGVTKSDTLDMIGNALVYGQMEAATMVQREAGDVLDGWERSEEHTSELQSLMRISYAVFCLKKQITKS